MSAKQFYENAYAQIADPMWQWREHGGQIKARNIATVASGLPIQTILDIGSGTGSVLAGLERLGFGQQYWALDIAEQAVALIQTRQDIPKLVEAQAFDGAHIPYQSEQFDLAILSHVVEHLADPRPLLREAARVARYIAVEVPLEDNLYTHVKVGLLRSRYREEIGHIQWFNQRSFRLLLTHTAGLELVRMEMVYLPDELYDLRKKGLARRLNILQLSVRKLLRNISSKLYTRLLTDHCIALVRARPR
jgi:SAM-dependent methyltransferase